MVLNPEIQRIPSFHCKPYPSSLVPLPRLWEAKAEALLDLVDQPQALTSTDQPPALTSL